MKISDDLRTAMIERAQQLQADFVSTGHAIECRINAEDPFSFAPAPGTISAIHVPEGPGVRVDTHLRAGYTIPSHCDSMIAKLIVHGADRTEALRLSKAFMRAPFDFMRCVDVLGPC